MFKMFIPNDVQYIIDRMHKFGHSAYVVGGSVRDSLIGRELGDFDITTDALPEETKAVFQGHRVIETGIKHGTVTLVLSGTPYEVTTYRVDGDYKDGRHPESVTFTASLEEDLARRDFTVNAMAYAPSVGLVDPFGGASDAELRIIRAVGDPYRRFDEDALRILRALRFASVLGFDIEDNTAFAARELSHRLSFISKERVYTELKKLICGERASAVIEKYSDILSVAFDGLTPERLPTGERFNEADYLTRLAALIYMNSSDPCERADSILSALKTDKFTRTHTISTLKAYENASFDTERSVVYTLSKHGREATDGALKLGILLGNFSKKESDLFESVLASNIPYSVSQLDIRGGDLISLGIGGEQVGNTLSELLCAVIDGRVENENTALMEYAGKRK